MEQRNYTYKMKLILLAIAGWEIIFWGIYFSSLYYLENNVDAFRFEEPVYLIFLWIVPVFALAFVLIYRWRNKKTTNLASIRLLTYLTIPISSFKTFLKYFLFRNAIVFFILALANPQYGKGTAQAVAEGIEVMVCLDISNSMRALDLDKKRSRLDVAKMAIDQFFSNIHNDRVGLIVFAGDAFVQVPLTNDYGAAKIFLNSVSPEMMTNQGTAIGVAIDKAMTSFDMENGVNKAIIVMSDGEDHEGGAEIAAERARENNIIVSTIGLATTKETPIPDIVKGKMQGLKKDAYGETVYTKLNEDMLIAVANKGGGSYTRAEGTFVNLDGILADIKSIEAKEIETKTYTEYEDQFQWFLIIGIILLIGDLFVSERRTGLIHKLQEYNG